MNAQAIGTSPSRTAFEKAMEVLGRFIRKHDVPADQAEAAFAVLEAYLGKGLKTGEVKKMLGVKSPTTIKKWIDMGRFPHAQVVNGQWRIPATDVMVVLEAGMRADRVSLLSAPPMVGLYEGDPDDLIG